MFHQEGAMRIVVEILGTLRQDSLIVESHQAREVNKFWKVLAFKASKTSDKIGLVATI